MSINHCKKILVIGCPGAGKTTLSVQLAKLLKLPLYHLDILYWSTDWIRMPDKDWNEQLSLLVKKQSWIIDGNYLSSLSLRLEHSDYVVYLDYRLSTCLWHSLKRFFFWKRSVKSAYEKIESIRKPTLRKQMYLMKLIIMFNLKQRPKMYKFFEKNDTVPIMVIKTKCEVNKLINALKLEASLF